MATPWLAAGCWLSVLHTCSGGGSPSMWPWPVREESVRGERKRPTDTVVDATPAEPSVRCYLSQGKDKGAFFMRGISTSPPRSVRDIGCATRHGV